VKQECGAARPNFGQAAGRSSLLWPRTHAKAKSAGWTDQNVFAPTTFPENRIADHRTGYKSYNLDQVINGALEPVIRSCIDADEAERLAALGAS